MEARSSCSTTVTPADGACSTGPPAKSLRAAMRSIPWTSEGPQPWEISTSCHWSRFRRRFVVLVRIEEFGGIKLEGDRVTQQGCPTVNEPSSYVVCLSQCYCVDGLGLHDITKKPGKHVAVWVRIYQGGTLHKPDGPGKSYGPNLKLSLLKSWLPPQPPAESLKLTRPGASDYDWRCALLSISSCCVRQAEPSSARNNLGCLLVGC